MSVWECKYCVFFFFSGPNSKGNEKPLLDEPIPESYLVLQDFVRELAEQCISKGKKPILTKKEYM